jgi:predicted SAM-dependent methyltransferase
MQMPKAPIRLHIGGEEAKTGWTILNIQDGPNVDAIGDCCDLSQFADGSVTEIYASHVFEHVGYLDDLPKALLECSRILSPGGKLRVSVPDFEMLCRLFIHPQLNAEQRFAIMRITFGGQTNAYDFHKVGLTMEFLEDYLKVAGFNNIERVETHKLFEDSSTLEVGGIPINLNVVASKPSA